MARFYAALCLVAAVDVDVATSAAVNETVTPLRVSISGQSAGGSMAMNHLFAFSSTVDGAGVAAGSAYGCMSLPHRGRKCYYGYNETSKNDALLRAYVQGKLKQGEIDDPKNLYNIPVLLFNGHSDWEVYTRTMQNVLQQLGHYVNKSKLASKFDTKASHVWSIDHGKCKCEYDYYDYYYDVCGDVENCHYDFSGDMLTRFYGNLSPRKTAKNHLLWIEQRQYIPFGSNETWKAHGMWKYAFAYVPDHCGKAGVHGCRMHINYHGCIKRDPKLRRMWAVNLDLNEYAEANNIIILYPQASGDKVTAAGCWNFGYKKDDPFFDTHRSVQLRTVLDTAEHLQSSLHGGRRGSNAAILQSALHGALLVSNCDAFEDQQPLPTCIDQRVLQSESSLLV